MALTLLIRCENVGQKSLIRLVKFKPISKKLKTGKTNILTHYSFARLLVFNPLSNFSLTTDPVNSFLLLLKKMLTSTLFVYKPIAVRSVPHVNRGVEPEFSSNTCFNRTLAALCAGSSEDTMMRSVYSKMANAADLIGSGRLLPIRIPLPEGPQSIERALAVF